MKLKRILALVLLTAMLLVTTSSLSSCGSILTVWVLDALDFIDIEDIVYEPSDSADDPFYYNTTDEGKVITGIRNLSITEAVIPDGVTGIDDYAFHGCFGFTSITIPDSVTSIGDSAFLCCTGLKTINYNYGK